MICKICHSEINLKKKYDGHTVIKRFRIFLKELLPYFNFLIPFFFKRLKKHSRKKNLFRGYIGICSNCGHGEMEYPPSKNELQQFYQEEYWTRATNKVEKALISDHAFKTDERAIHQVDFIMKKIDFDSNSTFNILEIGAGAAYSSLLLREKCKNSLINISVCEPGQQWDNYYKHHKINKIANYFPFEHHTRFDYVHTSHWLEHTLSLDEILSKLKEIVKPSGYLFIEVPNTQHFYWNLPETDTPHIHFFTIRSLVKALENHKFNCLNIGEFGITYQDKHNRVPLTTEKYGPCEKGFWIRGLFRKQGL